MSRRVTPNNSSFLDQHSRPPQTKIVCSLRISTDLQTIKHLLLSGMNVARISCAFGTEKELELLIKRIRDASTITKRLCAIILETHGTNAMVGPVTINKNTNNNNNNDDTLTFQSHSQSTDNNHNADDLQKIASTLNLEPDNLPLNILKNVSFALNNIINDNQNDPESQENNENDTEQKQEEEEEKEEEEKKQNDRNDPLKLSPLILPLTTSPRFQRGQLNVNNDGSSSIEHNITTTTTPIHRNLSYDGDSFIIQPDIYLIKDSLVRVITDRIILGDRKRFSICFPGLTNKLSVGKEIIIHPSIKLEIKAIDNKLNILTCLVLAGGPLSEYSKVEFPSLKMKRNTDGTITQQDVVDIGLAVQHYVDYICISHVKSINDINKTKEMLDFQTASIRNMKRNTSYDLSTNETYLHRRASDQMQSISNGGDDHITNNIKILAKIEDYQCLNDIYDIITESDGIIIDHISLLHSYKKHINNSDNDNIDKLKEKISEIIHDIICETRKQAKPFSICCDIKTTLNNNNNNNNDNNYSICDIDHDLKLLHDVPGIPININSFLTFDDIVSIEYCVAYGADSICLLSDINRLKQIYNQHHEDVDVDDHYNEYNEYNQAINKNMLYIHGIIKAISDVIKKKEFNSMQFYQNNYGKYSWHSVGSITSKTATKEMNIIQNNNNNNNNNNNHLNVPHNNYYHNNNNDEISPKSSSCPEDNESIDSYSDSDEQRKIFEVESIFNSMASSSVKTAFDLNCSLIIVLTQSGRIARIVSKYRPHCTILAITDSEIIAKQCMFISSIFPVLVLNMNGTDSLISRALYIAYKYKLIKKKNDKVVVLAGTQSDILDEPCDFIMKLLYVDL